MADSFDHVWETYLDTEADLRVRRYIAQQMNRETVALKVPAKQTPELAEAWQRERDGLSAEEVQRKEIQRRISELLESRFPKGNLHDFYAGDGTASLPWAMNRNKRRALSLVNAPHFPGRRNTYLETAQELATNLKLSDRVSSSGKVLIGDPKAIDDAKNNGGNVLMANTGLVFPRPYRVPPELGPTPNWPSVKRSLHVLGSPTFPAPNLAEALRSFRPLQKGTLIQMADTPYYLMEGATGIQAQTESYVRSAATQTGWKLADMQMGTAEDPFYTCTLERQ